MRTILLLSTICLFSLLFSCEKDEATQPDFSGTWVEQIKKMDSIDFTKSQMVVRRGFEWREGFYLPKYGSGIYLYKFRPDTIRINNMLWNCICYPSYYFKMNRTCDTFRIGNFFDPDLPASGQITFIRIK